MLLMGYTNPIKHRLSSSFLLRYWVFFSYSFESWNNCLGFSVLFEWWSVSFRSLSIFFFLSILLSAVSNTNINDLFTESRLICNSFVSRFLPLFSLHLFHLKTVHVYTFILQIYYKNQIKLVSIDWFKSPFGWYKSKAHVEFV